MLLLVSIFLSSLSFLFASVLYRSCVKNFWNPSTQNIDSAIDPAQELSSSLIIEAN
jgi:hypothetical protein